MEGRELTKKYFWIETLVDFCGEMVEGIELIYGVSKWSRKVCNLVKF